MGGFELILLLATLTCALVAGFLFAFAVVAMPGIARRDWAGRALLGTALLALLLRL